MKDLPPTATLHAVEVATRHATFTSASEELHVTQSAVSHQLKNFEDIWGVQLFHRGKSLSLTPAGAALAPIVATGLSMVLGLSVTRLLLGVLTVFRIRRAATPDGTCLGWNAFYNATRLLTVVRHALTQGSLAAIDPCLPFAKACNWPFFEKSALCTILGVGLLICQRSARLTARLE